MLKRKTGIRFAPWFAFCYGRPME